jgi:hypothetical protein
MENAEILGSTELQTQILLLKAKKSNNETELNQSFKELTQPFFIPKPTEKETLNEVQDSKRAFINLSKMVVNKATNYAIEQKFGQKRSFTDFLASMAIDLLATPFINKKVAAFVSKITN